VTGRGSTAFTQNTPGVPGSAVADGGFGAGAKVTDVHGDGHGDAMIGVYAIDEAGVGNHTGGLWTLPGSATATGSKAFTATSLGLPADGFLSIGQSFNR
jgi:hypothetical protein